MLHNAPGRFRPITESIAALIDGTGDTLDVANPYVTDRRMIGRIVAAAERCARVRLFVPADPNNWACGAAEQFHHKRLLGAGVQILGYPKMLHAIPVLASLLGLVNAFRMRRLPVPKPASLEGLALG